jgi:hypothetical protein
MRGQGSPGTGRRRRDRSALGVVLAVALAVTPALGLGLTGVAAGQTDRSALLDERDFAGLPARGFADIAAAQPFEFTAPDTDACSDLAGTLDAARAAATIDGLRRPVGDGPGAIDQTVWAFSDPVAARAFVRDLRGADLPGCSEASAIEAEPDAVVVIGSFRHFGERPRLSAETTPVIGAAAQVELGGPITSDFITFWSADGSHVTRVGLRTDTGDVVNDQGGIQVDARPAIAGLVATTHERLWVADASAVLGTATLDPGDLGVIVDATGRPFFVDRQPGISQGGVADLTACRRYAGALEFANSRALVGPGVALEAQVRTDVVVQDAWAFRSVRDARTFERRIERIDFGPCLSETSGLLEELAGIKRSTGLFTAVDRTSSDGTDLALWYRAGTVVTQVQVHVAAGGVGGDIDWDQLAQELGPIDLRLTSN